jgi:malate synthase
MPPINEEYYEELDREALLKEIERLNRDLNVRKSKLQASNAHLSECLKFIRKHEQTLLDSGVSPNEFIEIEIPF